MRLLTDHKLEIIVFVSGAVVMILEIVGSRVLAPYLGTSIFVWTSLIGVVLGALSFGYWYGGQLADKKTDFKTLSYILLLAAVSVWVLSVIKPAILVFAASSGDVRVGAVIAGIFLFAPPSLLLGMVSPYAIRLKIDKVKTSGSTVGTLYALSTLGSIIGTFSAGFFLISYLGTTNILLTLAVILTVLSVFAFSGELLGRKLAILLIVLGSFWVYAQYSRFMQRRGNYDYDTDYYRVWVLDKKGSAYVRPFREMQVSNETSSAMFLDRDDSPVFGYMHAYHTIRHFKPDFDNTLMLGGAGYAFPKDYLRKYPDAEITVVEIDPGLTELARKHFNLKDDPRLTIVHEDGRTFLNTTDRKYDAIFGDAFKSLYSVPFHLTTVEAVEQMHRVLEDDGVLFVNIISPLEGKGTEFIKSEVATFKQVFPHVYVFPIQFPDLGKQEQNVIIMAFKSATAPDFTSDDPEVQSILSRRWEKELELDRPILTDDFAPVEFLVSKML